MPTDDKYLDYIHEKLLCSMKAFDAYCRKYDIKYSVCGGTAIGAIRHKGFVPWDDDADVFIKRDEYVRLCKCIEKDPIPGFFLQTFRSDKNFPQDYAKLRMDGTEGLAEFIQSRINMRQGIFLDIFPIDNVEKEHKKFNVAMCRILDYLIWFKTALWFPPKAWLTPIVLILEILLVIPFLVNFIPIRWLSIWREKFFTRLNGKETDSVGVLSSYEGTSTCMPKEIFNDEYIDVPFEDMNVMILKDYDGYLSLVYHDYMTPPPEDKRFGKHAFINRKVK